MKLTHFLSLILGATLGITSAAASSYTGVYWTTGVSEAGGWYDINKLDPDDGDADDNMCYAAAAGNLIAWWQNGEAGSQLTSEAPKDLDTIWQTFIDANLEWDGGGDPLGALNWWIAGIYIPNGREDAEGWERFYVPSESWEGDLPPETLRSFGGYYYDQYNLTHEALADFIIDSTFTFENIMQVDFAQLLTEGTGLALAIDYQIEGIEEEGMGHAITLWGVEYDENGKLIAMWITDSDDQLVTLQKVAVRMDEENDKIWLTDYSEVSYYLSGVFILDAMASLEWPTIRMQAYVTRQVNPFTRNGRAGAALLPQVYLNATTAQSTALLAANEAPEQGGALASIMAAVDAGAVTDSDAAAIAGASTAVLGQALSDDMNRQLRAMRNRAAMGSYSADAVAPDEKGGCPELPGKFFAWVNAEGNRAEQNADRTAAGYTLSSWGGTVGAGMEVDSKLSFGLALTAMYGDLKSDGPDRLSGDMDTAYLSAFARYQSGSWSHSFIGALGTMESDYKRTAMGYSNYGDMEGSAFGFMYELSREFTLCDSCSISPVLNVAYRHTAVDGYSEHGTDAALNVGKQSLDTVTLALGARYAAMVGRQTLNRTCAFQARALGKYDFGDTGASTTVGFVDYATRAGIESAERAALGLELGAGISIPVGTGSIFTDGALELRSDYTNFNATVGYRIQF